MATYSVSFTSSKRNKPASRKPSEPRSWANGDFPVKNPRTASRANLPARIDDPAQLTLTLDTSRDLYPQDEPKDLEVVAESLEKLADLAEIELFTNYSTTDADTPGDVLSLSVPLLIKLLEYAREKAKDDKCLHILVEDMYKKSKNGDHVLTTVDYSGE